MKWPRSVLLQCVVCFLLGILSNMLYHYNSAAADDGEDPSVFRSCKLCGAILVGKGVGVAHALQAILPKANITIPKLSHRFPYNDAVVITGQCYPGAALHIQYNSIHKAGLHLGKCVLELPGSVPTSTAI